MTLLDQLIFRCLLRKLLNEAGLFVNLRIGTYICAEWNYRLPVWLNSVSGMSVHSDSPGWEEEIRFVTDIS